MQQALYFRIDNVWYIVWRMSDKAPNFGPANAADLIQRIVDTAKAAVPESMAQDVRDNVRAAIQDVISDLDVVSREELDVQKAVLAKTRAKVDKMELVIAQLEEKLSD